MVTPHSVGAPYHIQFFSHLAYVFDRSASLPKFFHRHQSFRSKCSDICYAPISHNLQTTVLLHLQVFPVHAIHKESLSWSSASDSQAIPHTQHIFFPLIFSFFFFSFFGCFMHCISSWCIKEWLLWFLARLEVILITLRVVTFFTPFPQVGVVSRLTMHPVMLSSLAAFLTSNNCDNRRHHTNHDPFFLQWKLYCSYGFWCFVCSW